MTSNGTTQQRCMSSCPSGDKSVTNANSTYNTSSSPTVTTASIATITAAASNDTHTVMAATSGFTAHANIATIASLVQSSAWEGVAIACTVVTLTAIVAMVVGVLLWRRRKTLFRAKVAGEHTAPPDGGAGAQTHMYSKKSIAEDNVSDVVMSRVASRETFLPIEVLQKNQHDVISIDPSRTGGVWF